ncbi:relaxin receptor 1-like isoform X2 [Ornithodoros turicata]
MVYHNDSKSEVYYRRGCNRTDVPEGCYCDLYFRLRVFCQSAKTTSVPPPIPDASRLLFEDARLGVLPENAFLGYKKLRNLQVHFLTPILHYRGTSVIVINSHHFYRYFTRSLSGISPGAFRGLHNVELLTIEHNSMLTELPPKAFLGLSNLTWLSLRHNRFEEFDVEVTRDIPNLRVLNLQSNGFRGTLGGFPDLKLLTYLSLTHNRLEVIVEKTFQGLPKLEVLVLSHNRLFDIPEQAFRNNSNLLEINLAFNSLAFLRARLFRGLRHLKKIDISSNPIKALPVILFHNLPNLYSLNLTGVEISNIDIRHFRHLPKLEFIYFKKFHYCSYAPYVRICMPKTDGLSSTEHLLVWPVLRLSVWIVALTTCAGNSVVLTWRVLSKKEDRVLSLFIKNLSMADFLMGVYLLTVGSLDVAFRDEYNKHAHQWMSSWHCTVCGLVAMVSCEVSVLILSLITIERYRCIKTNVRVVTVTAARYCLAVVWLAGLLLALFPVLQWPHERAFYSSNGLCFPLHIDDPFMLGWEYSAFVFLGINFFAMVLIMSLYLSMFTVIKEDRQRARPVTMKKQEDAVLALRFFFIVLTDCMCWIPIVIIKILALAEIPISENIYAWVVVFILPINSALNPVIYTLAAPTELRRRIEKLAQRLLKCHKRLECLLTTSRTPRSSVATQSLTGTDVPSVSTDCTSGGSVYQPVAPTSCSAVHEMSEVSEGEDAVL